MTERFGVALADESIKNLIYQLTVLKDTLAENALSLKARLFEHPHGGRIPGEHGSFQAHKPKMRHRVF